jgi:hypothetical protein
VQHRKQWLTRLADEFEKVEKLLPASFLPKAVGCPNWVENVEREMSLVMLPAAKLRDADYVVTPRRMGAVIGHGCEMAVRLMEWSGSKAQKAGGAVAAPMSEGLVKQVDELNRAFDAWYVAVRRLAKLSLCACVDQPYEDMRDFLAGYADGFARKSQTDKPGEMGSTTFEIYLYMIFAWPAIARLSSVRQLHEVLIKIFGASRIGDQKRVEKICQRIGLSFRKPGRPKKE